MAAKKILGYFPDIPASDPQQFAAALVENLSMYHPEVVARAADGTDGIGPRVKFLNLAVIREYLDKWAAEHGAELRRREKPLELPDPRLTAPADPKILQGLKDLSAHLTRGFSPGSV